MDRMPANRTPTHPGEMLLEEFRKPMNPQLKWDLSKAQETEAETLRKIHPVQAVG